ncbi:MAG: hypothetical protein HRT73_12820, partial [Flavobacteriales bacterium]|nr:hypothetical protein [Flavobacteriales bacterium]
MWEIAALSLILQVSFIKYKVIKKRKKILIALLLFLLIIAGAGTLASYNSSFQTTLVRQYLNSLAKKLETNISVGNVDVSLFNKLIITDLYVEDLHQDTLLYAKKIVVDIDEFSYEKKKIVLSEVELSNVYFNLKKYKGEKKINLNFIINHFTRSDTT